VRQSGGGAPVTTALDGGAPARVQIELCRQRQVLREPELPVAPGAGDRQRRYASEGACVVALPSRTV
jgi:hypothetical protein